MNEHARAHELLPWMVNGRIDSGDAAWLDGHLAHCPDCRSELAAQRRLRDAIAREPTVEFAPQAAFNRLWKRIEADTHGSQPVPGLPVQPATRIAVGASGGEVPSSLSPAHAPATAASPARSMPWMRATLVLQAAAIAVL